MLSAWRQQVLRHWRERRLLPERFLPIALIVLLVGTASCWKRCEP